MANQYKNKIVYNGTILLDLSGDTVTLPEHIMAGFVGHLADGTQVVGTGQSGGGSESTETLLGSTPYTLLEDADIKLVGDGSYTYSVSAIDAEFADRKNVTLSNTTLTDEGTYFELADTGASAWYASTANMYFDGLVADTSYTVTVDSLGDGTTCTGGYWVIRDANGDNTYGVINPLAGTNTLTFTATGTSINVFMASADSASFESGIKVARWRNMTITHAESSSGTDETLLGELKAGTQITSSPFVDVYTIIESSGTLRGKICVCLGDSVTALMAPPNDYPSVLASNTGMTVVNGGFEGCRMSDTHPTATYAAFSAVKLADAIVTGTWTTQDANISGFESGSYAPAHLTALKAVDWSNVDYITIFFGGNDAGDQYVYIDNTSNPTDTTTYVGAARYVYNRIHTAYPNIKIMFFTPIYRYWISEGKDSDEMTFTWGGNTYHYYDWGDALIASPPASGVPVIDMYRTLGINASNRTTYLLTSDQTHPSVAGCALIAQKIQTELTNHFLPSSGSSATLITKTITANGTYSAQDDSADGYSSVTVNVPPSGITPTGSINIATNRTHDVTNYASAVVNVPTSGGTPSATSHTILFEFTDGTDTTIAAYYDNSFISDAIRATTPITYDSKTVDSASLDGTAWYTRLTETWETLYDGNIHWMREDNGSYPYCWVSELGSIPITVGSIWRVTYNNTEYRCTGKIASLGGKNYNVIGNPGWSGGTDDGSDVPFTFIDYTIYNAWLGGLNVPNAEGNYYFKIERLVTS